MPPATPTNRSSQSIFYSFPGAAARGRCVRRVKACLDHFRAVIGRWARQGIPSERHLRIAARSTLCHRMNHGTLPGPRRPASGTLENLNDRCTEADDPRCVTGLVKRIVTLIIETILKDREELSRPIRNLDHRGPVSCGGSGSCLLTVDPKHPTNSSSVTENSATPGAPLSAIVGADSTVFLTSPGAALPLAELS